MSENKLKEAELAEVHEEWRISNNVFVRDGKQTSPMFLRVHGGGKKEKPVFWEILCLV